MLWFHDIAKNTIYQIIARVVTSGTSLLITIIVARHFGIAGYGDFAKATAFVTLFYLLSDFGLNAIFLQREESKIHFHDLLYPRLIFSVILVIIINSIDLILPYNPTTGIGFSPTVRLGISIYSFTIITESVLITASAIFQREHRYDFFMFASIIGSLVSLALIGLFAAFSSSLTTVFTALFIGASAECLTALFFTDEKLLPVTLDLSFVKHLARETLPISLMLFFNLAYFRADMILLSLMRPSSDVAIYDMSYKVFDFLIALPLFLSNSLYTKILIDEKNSRNENLTLNYLALFAISSFPIVILIWFLSPMLAVIKPEFIRSVVPLHILLLSLPVFFATNILQWLLIAKKKQKFLAWVYFLSTVINIVFNIIFIPSYGYIASATVTGVSEVLVFIALVYKLLSLKKSEKYI